MQNIEDKIYANDGNADVLAFLIEPGQVLDIGCGRGDNARRLKSLGYTIDGITISENELQEAGDFLQNGYIYNLENGLPKGVKNNRYDYIICSHVLEHICYPGKLLLDIKVCLKPGGKFIVALPNLFHYASRWKLVKGEFNYQNSGVWDNTHFKWYSFKTGKELLEQKGFTVITEKVTGELPGNSLFSKILPKRLAKALFSLLTKISPGLFGYQLLYVAKPSGNVSLSL